MNFSGISLLLFVLLIVASGCASTPDSAKSSAPTISGSVSVGAVKTFK